MPEEMPNIETGKSAEKLVSEYTFREAFANRQRLTRQKETASGDTLAKIEAGIVQVKEREDFLVGEVEQEGGLMGLDQDLGILRDMLDAGELSPSHLFEARNIAPQLDNLAGLESSDPHVGAREWYYRKNLDEIAKDLREEKRQALQGQRRQPRAQLQPVQPPVAQRGQPLNSADVASTEAEEEIFGRTEAFSERWVIARGMPVEVRYFKGLNGEDDIEVGGSTGIFNTAELFSTILETGGKDYRANRQLAALFEAYKGTPKERLKFSSSVVNGFIALASLKDALNSSRIDTLAEALRRGPPPQGIAQWLLFDPETRRSLALIMKLEGYAVADEVGANGVVIQDEIKVVEQKVKKDGKEVKQYYLSNVEVVVDSAFSDHQHIRPDEIKTYLEAVRKAVGTDPGVVKLAYYIFRVLGHPHENKKLSEELIGKYEYGNDDEGKLKGDLNPKDITPFVVRFDDPTKSRDKRDGKTNLYFKLPPKHGNESDGSIKNKVFLEDVLEKEGVIGFALSLNGLPAEKIVREWSDMQLILDMMDQISDIRVGLGAGSSLEPSERLKAIRSVKELGTALAKRKLSQETVDRLIDTSRIDFTPGSTAVSFWERTLYGMKVPISGMGKEKPKVRSKVRR